MTSRRPPPATEFESVYLYNIYPRERRRQRRCRISSFEFLPLSPPAPLRAIKFCGGFRFPFSIICKYSLRVFFFLYYSFSLFPFCFLCRHCQRAGSFIPRRAWSSAPAAATTAVENYNISFFIVTHPYLGGFILPNDNLTPGDEWLPAGRFFRNRPSHPRGRRRISTSSFHPPFNTHAHIRTLVP